MRTFAWWILAMCSAGCGSPPPHDYRAYLAHMPRSILVLPPVNDSLEPQAPNAFLASVTRPLAERGYYVFPVAVVEAYMRQNGRPTPADMHAVAPSKLVEVFGADAALYIHIKDWGTSYAVLNSASRVVIDCRLVDLRSEALLWTGSGMAVENSGNGGSLVGALASALVNQVAASVHDPCPALARRASSSLFAHPRHGLLLGWRHPDFERDQVAHRAAAQ
ncbi:MAG: DUF799 family lipoprotein [Planctomycetota bacterium]